MPLVVSSSSADHKHILVPPTSSAVTDASPDTASAPSADYTPTSLVPATSPSPSPAPARYEERLVALQTKLHEASARVVGTLPPPQVYVDLDLSLDVMDLQECMKQLKELCSSSITSNNSDGSGGGGGSSGPPVGGAGEQARTLKEMKILKLQRSIVARVPKQTGWCPEHPDFEDALADLCVRMKLYTQLSGLVDTETSSAVLD
jgi:hypothetical protein